MYLSFWSYFSIFNEHPPALPPAPPLTQRGPGKRLNVICGEHTFTTPRSRLKLMIKSMMINRKLVMTSAKSKKSNFHITKSWSLMYLFNCTSREELNCDNLAEATADVTE